MRIKCTLTSGNESGVIPVNCQYKFLAWIYQMIRFGNPGFAAWLHNRGWLFDFVQLLESSKLSKS